MMEMLAKVLRRGSPFRWEQLRAAPTILSRSTSQLTEMIDHMESGKMKKIASLFASAILMVTVLGMTSSPAAAQQKEIDLKGDVKLEKVVTNENGEETVELVAPDTIVPGDKLIFGTDYTNKGAQAVANFVVTNPVPKAVRLAPDASEEIDHAPSGVRLHREHGCSVDLPAEIQYHADGRAGSRCADGCPAQPVTLQQPVRIYALAVSQRGKV